MMTNEELVKALEVTQEGVTTLADVLGRMIAVLRVHGVLTDLDSSYIKMKITEDDYIKQYKDQNKLSNLYGQIFNQMFQTDVFTEDKKKE